MRKLIFWGFVLLLKPVPRSKEPNDNVILLFFGCLKIPGSRQVHEETRVLAIRLAPQAGPRSKEPKK